MLRGGSAALEAAAVAVAGKRLVTRLHPHVTDGLGIIVGGMVVSRNMFADHVPDKQLAQVRGEAVACWLHLRRGGGTDSDAGQG